MTVYLVHINNIAIMTCLLMIVSHHGT